MGHLDSQERLEDGRPEEAVLQQEAVLFRDEERQDQHVCLQRETFCLSLAIIFLNLAQSHFHCWDIYIKHKESRGANTWAHR